MIGFSEIIFEPNSLKVKNTQNSISVREQGAIHKYQLIF